jgi:hypothetical protein
LERQIKITDRLLIDREMEKYRDKGRHADTQKERQNS